MMPRNYDRRRRDRGSRRSSGGSGGGQGRSRVANSQAVDNTPVPEGIIFYCKTCEQIVDYHPASFNFKYPIEGCKKKTITEVAAGTPAVVADDSSAGTAASGATSVASSTSAAGSEKTAEKPAGRTSDRRRAEPTCDIAYGTERSIKQYYKIKDDKYDAERRAREEKAARADKL